VLLPVACDGHGPERPGVVVLLKHAVVKRRLHEVARLVQSEPLPGVGECTGEFTDRGVLQVGETLPPRLGVGRVGHAVTPNRSSANDRAGDPGP
jgi:hypothetical protein